MLQQWSPRKWHGVPGFISWPSITPATQPSQHAVHSPHCRAGAAAIGIVAPQHFLYFLPLPQGQGSLRPTGMENEARTRIRPVYFAAKQELRSCNRNTAPIGRLSRRPVVPVARREHARREDGGVALRARGRRHILPGRIARRALRGVSAAPRGLRRKAVGSHRREAAPFLRLVHDGGGHSRAARSRGTRRPPALRDIARPGPYLLPRLDPPPHW